MPLRAGVLIAILTALLAAIGIGSAQEQPPQELRIYNVWMRPTAAEPADDVSDTEATEEADMENMDHGDMSMSGVVSAAYMTIENTSDMDYRLIAVEFDAAAVVEIHETQIENDVMQMRPVGGGLRIPAGETVELQPGGYHLMLMDITRDFYPDTAASLTLVFEGQNEDRVQKTVGALVTDFPPEPTEIYAYDLYAVAHRDRTRPLDALYALYGTFVNPSSFGHTLNSVTTTAGSVAELRQTSRGDGEQSTLVDFMSLPPNARLLLQPGNLFIQIEDVPTALEPGDAFIATFNFSDDVKITAAVPVVELETETAE